MSGLNVETSAMQGAIKGFENCAQDLSNAMKQMQQQLEEQLNSNTYRGLQATAFQQVCSQIEEDLTTASNQLANMSQTMQSVFTNYQQGDSEAASEFSKLTSLSNSSASTGQAASATLSRLAGS